MLALKKTIRQSEAVLMRLRVFFTVLISYSLAVMLSMFVLDGVVYSKVVFLLFE
jgi:uncharacterized membrane protein YwzB